MVRLYGITVNKAMPSVRQLKEPTRVWNSPLSASTRSLAFCFHQAWGWISRKGQVWEMEGCVTQSPPPSTFMTNQNAKRDLETGPDSRIKQARQSPRPPV